MAAPSTGNDYAECFSEPGKPSRCRLHGGLYITDVRHCQTVDVLADVRAERTRQFATYGLNDDLEYGTGQPWLLPFAWSPPESVQAWFRSDYEEYEAQHRKPTWMHLIREEVAEAFAETDPTRLREELLQVAALCVSWIEKIDAKEAQR